MPPTTTTEKRWQPRLAATKRGYRDLVAALEAEIRGGSLQPGDQLPPHRELSSELGVSRGTVARAYEEGQRLGLLRSGIGQGTFVADAFSVRARRRADTDVIDFGMGFPIYELDPDPASVLVDLARDPKRYDLLRYPQPDGLLDQRASGARWCAELGVETPADGIFITAGAQNAVHLWLLSVLERGETLLTGELTYRMVASAAAQLGIRVRGVAMDEEGILPDALERDARATKARGLYVMPTIQNPTTGVLSRSRRKALIKVVETCGLQVLEDDIHGLYHPPPRPTPLRELCPERVTYVASLSKTLAGGLRVAFAVPPINRRPAYRSALVGALYGVPPLAAEIAARWIGNGTAFEVVAAKREEALLRTRLTQERLGPLVPMIRCGAYYCWMKLPDPWTAMRFTMEAQRRRVSVTPGEAFFVGDGEPPEAVRLSLGATSRDQIHHGLAVLEELLRHPTKGQDHVV